MVGCISPHIKFQILFFIIVLYIYTQCKISSLKDSKHYYDIPTGQVEPKLNVPRL